jgi:uncharacterized caspase-like protein
MRVLLRSILATLALSFLSIAGVQEAWAQRRLALVVGNSAYKHASALANPKNDAADLAALLRRLDFEVVEGHDLDKASMDRTIRNFAEKLAGSQLALFFYAGHGLQVSGQNYLVPIDAQLSSGAALDFETVRLDLIQRTMERETATNIVIVDACRDNPLARNLARALGTRSISIGKGLAAMESGDGTLISFSTQPGNVALDGTGRNSPFARALLKHLPTPGDDLPTILINVRNDVMAATQRRQVPWEHSALTSRVYFTPPKPAGPTVDLQIELSFWASVKDSQSPAVLQTYIDRYPKGEFVALARALIEHYERQAKAAEAERAEAEKRQEEARRAAELKRLEDERRAKEEALAIERRRAAQQKDSAAAKAAEEKAQTEARARDELLRKALDEVIAAREAARKAVEQNAAATKAAGDAKRAAAAAIEAKRVESTAEEAPAKVAALPKLSSPAPAGDTFDGIWLITHRSTNCRIKYNRYPIIISQNQVSTKGGARGHVTPTGNIRWTGLSRARDIRIDWRGTLRGSSGTGSYAARNGKCDGTFSATRR